MSRPSDSFFNHHIEEIFTTKKVIVDIGGGLRLFQTRGNSYAQSREWIRKYLNQVNYYILDPVKTYKPNLVGDIHFLPYKSNSVDAIICLAVLEHVKNPWKAVEEMYRVLKPKGCCLIYVPFIYVYHAEPGYYEDYWRFTEDAVKYLGRNFLTIEVERVRGPLETWFNLMPFGRSAVIKYLSQTIDKRFAHPRTKQTSGYRAYLIK
jgi:SAM-dependent methyltransferase